MIFFITIYKSINIENLDKIFKNGMDNELFTEIIDIASDG